MRLVFATNNEHKLSEIRDILGEKVEILSLNDIGCHVDIPETGETLEENALQKAQYVFDHYDMDVFADDTGLEVEALDGAPGVHTARFADEVDHDAEANTRKLLKVMADKDNGKARFRTAIALIRKENADKPQTSNLKPQIFEGIVNGEITREKRGEKGFGYDPVFIPEGYDQTFAELGVEVKNQISHRARAVQKLVDYLSSLVLVFAFLFLPFYLFTFLPLTANAQTGVWHNYMAYHDVQDICSSGEELYVQASNSLYTYNLNDQSISTYDKVNGLSDTYITHIKWNPTAKRLIIIYKNQNIDMMEQGGEVTNLSDLYQKAMTADKTVNSIYNYKQYAYLACGFGIVKVDMQRIEISESYNLGVNVTHVAISNGNIYAKQKNNQVLSAKLTDNLLDPHNWVVTTSYDASIFNDDRTDYNQYLETVKMLNPGGPKYNYFGFLRFINGTLYSCNGKLELPSCVQTLNNGEWTIYNDEGISSKTGVSYQGLYCLDVQNTAEGAHLFAGGRNGLYEFLNGNFVNYYDYKNSPIEIFDNKHPEYQLITGVKFDNSGALWFLNSQAPTTSLVKFENGEFTKFNKSELMKLNDGGFTNKSNGNLANMMIDSRGLMWFTNNHWMYPALYTYDINNDVLLCYSSFTNQDGSILSNLKFVTSVTEDKEGNMWVGTDVGPLLLEKSKVGTSADDMIFTQVKVPRNDGTNYADYLLSGVSITCIMVDNDNRKWFGTEDNGVYVISSDNMTEVCHFTTDNSQLLSDIIGSIAINEETGEVFIGTENGLCSYMSGVTGTITEMTEDNVWAYPNPVTPDYMGLITVTGLTDNASVKILSSNGVVVAEGKSSGRTFTWNGRDKNGERVASGVYMVATATSSGEKGVVCKIAIVN